MRKTRKVLSIVLALMMLVSYVSVGNIQAATTISYAPNPKVEYGYSSGVTTGTIRYISQIRGSTYFNSNYWGSWASQAGIECGTASISMALSYVGVNKTPKAILDAHSGTTYFTGWGPTTSNPSVANGMNNYINGNGKYSPPIVHFTTGYASGSHYVILIGKVSSSSYLVLDPASNSTWTLSTSDAKYKSINQVFQYYNASASIVPDIKEPTTILYPTSGATFKIASGVGNNMYLDFSLSSDNVQIFEDGDSNSDPAWVKSQYFTLNHVGDGWYTITNVGNGSLVDVALADPSSGTNIQQCVANGSNAQLYRFYDAGDGYCYIKSKLGTCVDVQNADNFNRANVWAYSFNGTNAQKWKLIKKDVPNFDTEKPVIRHVEIYDVTLDGYQVYCSVLDNDEVVRVAFPTWTSHNGQDDLIWADGKIFSDQAFFDVKTSDHNNEYGEYITHIYAYDAVGNVSDIVEISVTIEDNKKFTLDYRVVNNTVTITGKGSFDGENLVIPSTIAGFPVTAIGNYAFEGYTNLKSITVPNSVTSIGNYAFWSCENLESIIIGDNVTNIGDGAFYRCQSLENITLPKKLTSIGLQSFMFCSKLKNITIPNGVTSIAESAFDSCFSLTSLIIPGSLKNIDRAVFNNCRGLESIIINNGVKTISPLAFNLCTNLKSIVIPKSITSIGSNAFNSCEEIKYIFYGGSPTDAKNISIDTGNSSLTSAHWHYETTRHNYSDTVTKHPTCTSAGVKTFTCSCSVSYTETISKVPHSDDDNDKICDVCSEVLGSITPDTPEEPAIDCSCNCHKGGIAGFFFKLILFFQRIFGMNKECKCGIAHY